MKNGTITLKIEQERLNAISFYAAKKGFDIQAELNDCLQRIYEKVVPSATREYIESRPETASLSRKDRVLENEKKKEETDSQSLAEVQKRLNHADRS
jgi:hypothetical protein